MSEIRVNTIKSEDGASPISFNKGVNVSGVATATSFVGDLTGDVTGDLTGTATNASGLTGSPNITVTNITGVAATFSGVLTYDDVTNVDSVGVVTARSGLEVVGIMEQPSLARQLHSSMTLRAKMFIENVSAQLPLHHLL